MFTKSRVASVVKNTKFRLALAVLLCSTAIAAATLMRTSLAAPAPAFGPTLLHFHGNPNDDSGYTGVGTVDLVNTVGPFMAARDTLGTGPAAHWDEPAPPANGTADQNPYDPNWIWTLDAPTTLRGPMTARFWASCSGCASGAVLADWNVRVWADGTKILEQRVVDATPALPNVPQLLEATVDIPQTTATSKFVIQIDPVYGADQANTHIFYDSQSPCPGVTGSAPCDSTVTMPVVDPNASPTPTPEATATPTPAPPGAGTPRFQVYVPSSSFSGGEPSIGTNWVTGSAMYLASYSPLRINFDDSTSPARDTWTNTTIPSAVSLDPILFTDHNLPAGMPNRTFVSQLTGQDSITFYTDDDGANYSPSQGGGIPSGVDHQTIGAGPYKLNTTPSAGPRGAYPNAVYYCSQEAATAFCARSDDGGQTFGPGIPIYELLQCTGIHGHVKVAPDGTVYVPNRSCGSKAAVVASNDNGVTWTVQPDPASSTSGFLVDPSVGIGANNIGKPTGQASNTIYLGYQAADRHPRIAVSHDQGATWVNDQDVGTLFGIENSTFPEVVAGDDNRAAYAFLGTTVPGDYTNQATFTQSAPWHLYIATTFDGGMTWTTTDVTPNDPVQRGSICNLGTTSCNHNPNDRNLLDFMDATVDAQGRTLVGYPDGCVGSCVKKPTGNFPNSYTSRASIARQSGGRRLFLAFDPTEPNLPAAPRAKAEISTTGGPTIISWPAADDAGSPITSYKIYRRDGANGSFNFLTTVTGTSFSDTTFTAPATSNAYHITAVNGFGEGPYSGDVVPVVVTFESSCVYPYITVGSEGVPGAVPADPTSGELTIQRLNVGEPFTSCDDNSLTFIMKVNTLDPQNAGMAVLPPNSEWQILFGITDADGNAERAYVAVDTFSPNTPATPRISIGRRDPTATGTLDSRVCSNDLTNTCPAISATFNKDGTIVFKLNLAAPISFGAPGTGATGTAFTWDARAEGTTIGAAQVITGTTYLLAGAGAGLLETVQSTSGEEYTRVGNMACANGLPNAALTANPTSGNAPLTVNFDASGSSVPQSCNTIASYTLDFGDGSQAATQATPTFSHTYSAGNYTAHLTITDSAGNVSTNQAQAAIHAAAAPSPTPTPTPIQPAPLAGGVKLGFQNFEAPGTLVNVTSSSQGPMAKTVEYLGHDAGEPSVGNNWKSGATVYQSDLQTLFVNFNDNCPSNGQAATWVNRPAPTSQFVDSDPIGFTDRYTGRTFASELTLLSPTSKSSFTDDDGQTWVVSQGSGLGASVDHQTIGGGPFHSPLTRPTNVPGVYPDAVYYCSQSPAASCARSDDGGLTYGPSIEVDPVADGHCGGLHGHIKVAPDGTIYLPFNYCDNQGAVIVSQDNGVNWTIQHVPQTSANPNLQDPAVGIDNDGKAYFVMASATSTGSMAIVATTTNSGQSWENVYDVGAVYGLKNIAYPAAVAADAGRAAVAFYGTTTTGDESANGFRGVWHLYVAETFDGGQHWNTTDVTPNAPIQRGCIWMHGGANICRNLLDFFDMTVDRDGRVEVGYVNGCAGGACAQAGANATGNAYTALATIARQSSGPRLVASVAVNAVSAPGMPSVTTRRVGNVVHLGWSEADDGNSPINSYKIMRGTSSGGETLLTTVAGNQSSYDDTTATDTSKTYYYKVLAVNGVGTSCGANEVAAPYAGDTCNGLILQRNDPAHPESALAAQNPSLAIDYIAAGEPAGTNDLMFKMKVSTLSSVPVNSRWRIVWNSETAPGQQWYVGMRSDANRNVSFEYGSVSTAVVGLVIGVPTETTRGTINGSFNPDGTITLYVSKALVGNPQPGDLLGAVNGRTFTGDNAETQNFERSTLLIDHTFVKAQRDNGSPAATYVVTGNTACSQFIEQNVNSMVTLQVTNPATVSGVSSYDLAMKNTSTQTIFASLRLEVASITSASGKVTVANADNSGGGAGAMWNYSSSIGSDNALTAGETSTARTLRFNNPNKEAFTVTFNVIGNLARAPGGGASGGAGASSGGGDPTAGAANSVYSVLYNPLLNSVTSKLLKQ